MSKTIRKLSAVMLVLAMVFSCGTVAFADTAPAPTAPSVMIDGKYVEFTDAVPQNVNGRIMVPFTAIFEALGATVNYDRATKTVSANKDDIHLSFVVGESELSVKEGSEVTKKTMDVASFIEPNTSRTFVPTRVVAEALGYAVGWDKAAKSVVIIDFETVFAKASEDFSILLKSMETDPDALTTTYQSNGDLALALTMYKEGIGTDKDVTGSISGTYTGTQEGLDVDMDMVVKVDVKDFVALSEAGADVELAQLLKQLENLDMEVKMDGESGDMWIKCALLDKLSGLDGKNIWYKMNLYDVYDQMGIDLKSMMESLTTENMDIMGMITEMIAQSSVLTVNTYEMLNAGYSVAKSLLGDEAFTKTTAGGTATYTAKIDGAAITKVMSAYVDEAEIKAVLEELDALEATVEIKERNDAITSFAMNYKLAVEGMSMSMDLSGDENSAEFSMSMDLPALVKLVMTSSSIIKETNDSVDIALPKDATVVDAMQQL